MNEDLNLRREAEVTRWASQRQSIQRETIPSCLCLFRGGEGETAAHLASQLAGALACLQDGHLHVLCGFFGLDGLLRQ